jgi:hypothetical protein
LKQYMENAENPIFKRVGKKIKNHVFTIRKF